jgi:hypothetical protein
MSIWETNAMNKNDERKQEQNSKKLFQKGGLPGPGRGKKKPFKPITIEQIERSLQQDLRSRDPKIRHPAVKLLLTLKKQSEEPDNSQTLDPVVQEVLSAHFRYLFEDHEVEEIEGEF